MSAGGAAGGAAGVGGGWLLVHADLLSSAATIEAMKTEEWLLANYQVSGYYRVNYDQANWEKLLHTLNTSHTVRRRQKEQTSAPAAGCADWLWLPLFQDIPLINRAQLVDDAFNLARSVPGTEPGPLGWTENPVRFFIFPRLAAGLLTEGLVFLSSRSFENKEQRW